MKPEDVARHLGDLLETKSVVEQEGPNSDPGRAWLVSASVALGRVDPRLKVQFDHYLQFIGLPLSSDTLGPIWANMTGLVREGIARVELGLLDEESPPVDDGAERPTTADITAPSPIDVKDLTVADVIRVTKRLKVSSVVLLLTLFFSWSVAFAKLFPTSSPTDSVSSDFDEQFTIQFADQDVLAALVPGILGDRPDGLSTPEQVSASLIWQVKSQGGFAEFLTGRESVSVTVVFSEDSMEFEWTRGASIVPQILNNVGLPDTPEVVARLNAELNQLGVAVLDESTLVVRSTDGGLAVVGSDR